MKSQLQSSKARQDLQMIMRLSPKTVLNRGPGCRSAHDRAMAKRKACHSVHDGRLE